MAAACSPRCNRSVQASVPGASPSIRDDVPQRRQSVADCLEPGQHPRILDERHLRLTVTDDIRELFGRQRVIQADWNAARIQ